MSIEREFKEPITRTYSFPPPALGAPCPRCAEPLVRRAKAFHGRSGYCDGAYCVACNRAWAIRGEEEDPGEVQ